MYRYPLSNSNSVRPLSRSPPWENEVLRSSTQSFAGFEIGSSVLLYRRSDGLPEPPVQGSAAHTLRNRPDRDLTLHNFHPFHQAFCRIPSGLLRQRPANRHPVIQRPSAKDPLSPKTSCPQMSMTPNLDPPLGHPLPASQKCAKTCPHYRLRRPHDGRGYKD